MGRVKIEIKKLDNSNGRQATYSKRKQGILKKAQELSILCDIDLILLMFSPTGKASVCCGKQSIEEIIEKYAQLPAQERVKRKLEGLQALKKTFMKSDHDVNIPDFDCSRTPTTQDLSNDVVQLQHTLTDTQERLSCWTNSESVNDVEVLSKMEDSLKESLQQIRQHKETIENQQFVKLDSDTQALKLLQHDLPLQLQNDLELPFHVSQEPQLQDLSTWIPFDDIQHMGFPEDLKLPSQRSIILGNVGCCSGPYFTGPYGYPNMSNREDALSSIQPSQENNFGGHLSSNQVPIALGGQYPYSLDMMGSDKGFQHLLSMDLEENTLDYDFEIRSQPPPQGLARSDASTNHILPMMSCSDFLFGEDLNSQKGSTIPSPMASSLYKTVANDPSRMLYDLLN